MPLKARPQQSLNGFAAVRELILKQDQWRITSLCVDSIPPLITFTK